MIRILLVDDQNLVQQGIKSLLDQDEEFKVIGTVKDGKSAIKQINLLRPDIVLLDIEMPGMNGISVTKYINHFLPETKVIILSSHEDKKYLIQALVAGAKAYILKNSLMTDLKQAIIAVDHGYSQIESRLLAKVLTPRNVKSSTIKSDTLEIKNTNNQARDQEQLLSNKQATNTAQVSSLSEVTVSQRETAQTIVESEQKTKIQSSHANNLIESEPKTKIPQTETEQSKVTESEPKIATSPLTSHSLDEPSYQEQLNDRSTYDLYHSANETALVPVRITSSSENTITFGANLKRPKSKIFIVKNYLQQLGNNLKISKFITPIVNFSQQATFKCKTQILQHAQPAISKYYPTLGKSKFLLFIGHKNTQRWLANISLMLLGGIIVLILHNL